MRDATAVLLVLMLTNMLLDYAVSRWSQGRGKPFGPVGILLMALGQGLAVAALVYAFDRHAEVAVAAGAGFALCWGLIRVLMSKVASPFAFAVRFGLQVLVLTLIWLWVEGYWGWAWESSKAQLSTRNLLVLLAYLMVWRPASAVIGAVLTPFLVKDAQGSLKKAGTWIGYLERTLILTFVLLEQWQAIGFLLTAKSILRFNDIKGDEQRSLSEYVLLGTLVSFTVSIAIGLAVLKGLAK